MRREFQNSLNLLPRHAEFFHQLVNAHILKVLEHRGHGHPGAFKHPCAAALTGDALHGRALGPIESCHGSYLPFIAAYSFLPQFGGGVTTDCGLQIAD
jgi:hypothetical protein